MKEIIKLKIKNIKTIIGSILDDMLKALPKEKGCHNSLKKLKIKREKIKQLTISSEIFHEPN